MRAKRKRGLVEQSHDTKNSLRRHSGGEQDSSTGATPRLPGVNRVQTGKYPDRIGHHAMVELNGKCVLEQVAPDGAHKPEPLCSRHNGVIDRRPGIEDEARVETGHQRAKINLQQQQNCDNERAGTQPDQRFTRSARRKLLRCPQDRCIDRAGQREVKSKTILRDTHALREARRNHPPPDSPKSAAGDKNSP